jgi:hypothetical protein
MKKFALALILGVTLYSCGKCKKLDCQNDAGCSVTNGKATCNCSDFFTGERCDSELRAEYFGVYNGTTTATVSGVKFSGNPSYSVESYSSAEYFKMVTTNSDGTSNTWYCKLTGKNDFTVQRISASGISSVESSGTISGNNLKASGNYSFSENGVSLKALFTINVSK